MITLCEQIAQHDTIPEEMKQETRLILSGTFRDKSELTEDYLTELELIELYKEELAWQNRKEIAEAANVKELAVQQRVGNCKESIQPMKK